MCDKKFHVVLCPAPSPDPGDATAYTRCLHDCTDCRKIVLLKDSRACLRFCSRDDSSLCVYPGYVAFGTWQFRYKGVDTFGTWRLRYIWDPFRYMCFFVYDFGTCEVPFRYIIMSISVHCKRTSIFYADDRKKCQVDVSLFILCCYASCVQLNVVVHAWHQSLTTADRSESELTSTNTSPLTSRFRPYVLVDSPSKK